MKLLLSLAAACFRLPLSWWARREVLLWCGACLHCLRLLYALVFACCGVVLVRIVFACCVVLVVAMCVALVFACCVRLCAVCTPLQQALRLCCCILVCACAFVLICVLRVLSCACIEVVLCSGCGMKLHAWTWAGGSTKTSRRTTHSARVLARAF